MRKVKVAFVMSLTVLTLSFMPSMSYAKCYCACVNNKKVKVCQNSWDSNYVYCGGGWCSAKLEDPENDKIKMLYALLEDIGELSKFDVLTKRQCLSQSNKF